MSGSILDGIDIDVTAAAEAAKSIHSPDLRPIAAVFARNVDELLTLLSLPLILLTVGASSGHSLVFFTQALVRTKNVDKWHESEEARAEVEAEARRLAEAARDDPKFRPVDEAKAQLTYLIEHHDLEGPARALLYAACSSAWSSLECAAKDAWIAALNSRPFQLAQPALTKLPDEPAIDGLTGKQVSVGLLARHGFDLRNSLGTLLSPKFDFTSVSGIRTAYEAAFGRSSELNKLLSVPELSHLEATRHLVVHRAGLVDEEYIRRTGDSVAIGAQLPLAGARVSELANAAVTAGARLLQIVDTWLIQNPPREPAPDAA